jgi:PPK2 family polyphosphate:nucleotide phosphotransferase
MSDRPDLRTTLRVKPGSRVNLSKLDADATHGWKKSDAVTHQAKIDEQLANLQDRLWAEGRSAVLVVLQGIDASGKDGTIRHVMTAFNPQGCDVASFKVPTAEEAAHDFLWRIHRRTPGKGYITIFNRSHYEQVLVVRVHSLEPRAVWKKHYDQIREFERLLTENGTTIVKFFLHIDKDEQRQRFQDRYDDPKKRWKFSLGDLEERKHWSEYIAAYQDALSKTSTDDAPWYVIPANHNWMRNLAVGQILADTIADLQPAYPPEPDLPKNLVIE